MFILQTCYKTLHNVLHTCLCPQLWNARFLSLITDTKAAQEKIKHSFLYDIKMRMHQHVCALKFIINHYKMLRNLFVPSAVECPPLPEPYNGYHSCLEGNQTFNMTCRLKCDPGFFINGSSFVTCEDTGDWSGPRLTCAGNFMKSSKSLNVLENLLKYTDQPFIVLIL